MLQKILLLLLLTMASSGVAFGTTDQNATALAHLEAEEQIARSQLYFSWQHEAGRLEDHRLDIQELELQELQQQLKKLESEQTSQPQPIIVFGPNCQRLNSIGMLLTEEVIPELVAGIISSPAFEAFGHNLIEHFEMGKRAARRTGRIITEEVENEIRADVMATLMGPFIETYTPILAQAIKDQALNDEELTLISEEELFEFVQLTVNYLAKAVKLAADLTN